MDSTQAFVPLEIRILVDLSISVFVVMRGNAYHRNMSVQLSVSRIIIKLAKHLLF